MGMKDAPCEHPSPANDFRTRPVRVCTSAPAFTLSPSAFTLLPHRLPRPPRSNRHPAAAVIHNGLSTEKLSTSLLAALCKTFSPSRLRTRIYNISFVRRPLPGVSAPLWPRVPRRRAQGGGGRGQRRTPPRAVPNNAACVPNHCAQWRKCIRQSPLLPVRSPRPCPPAAEPLPLVCRITVRKGGVHKAIPAPARAFSPRLSAYGRVPCPLMGEVPCAGWGGRRQRRTPPRAATRTFAAYRRAPAA